LFIGKTIGLFLQLIVLEILMMIAMVTLFDSAIDNFFLIIVSGIIATIGIASTGTLYGVLATGLGVRETLLPILLLPVLAPVVVGATRAFGDGFGRVNADGWAWVGLLSVVSVLYTVLGMLAYGQLLEEA
ncbi:MAG: heme exporter protein CcmB, partial [Actinomycetota bacterium]